MTRNYQQSHAGGFAAYQQFWGAIQRVTTSNVTAQPDGSVQATITYYYKDGRVVNEPTNFVLVNENGELKIADSTPLSSQ